MQVISIQIIADPFLSTHSASCIDEESESESQCFRNEGHRRRKGRGDAELKSRKDWSVTSGQEKPVLASDIRKLRSETGEKRREEKRRGGRSCKCVYDFPKDLWWIALCALSLSSFCSAFPISSSLSLPSPDHPVPSSAVSSLTSHSVLFIARTVGQAIEPVVVL